MIASLEGYKFAAPKGPEQIRAADHAMLRADVHRQARTEGSNDLPRRARATLRRSAVAPPVQPIYTVKEYGEQTCAIRTEGLSCRIGGVSIVDDVSLEVREGEFLVVIGPNGAGKTTLFNLFSGVARPTPGAITFCGTRRHPRGAVRARAARPGADLSNVERLLPLSTLENVRLAAQAHLGGSGAVWRLADPNRVALERARAALESKSGLTNACGVPRRGALARREAQTRPRDPVVPRTACGRCSTSRRPAWPSKTSPTFSHLFQSMHRERGATVLMVEHRLDLVSQLADRMAVMHHGSLLADRYAASESSLTRPCRPRISEILCDVARSWRCAISTCASASRTFCIGFHSTVRSGGITGLLGRNGVGKTTTLRGILGLCRSHRQRHAGRRADRHAAVRIESCGAASATFPKTATSSPGSPSRRTCAWPNAPATSCATSSSTISSPSCATRAKQLAGTLSGGQQQMVAMARALLNGGNRILADRRADQRSRAAGRAQCRRSAQTRRGGRDDPSGRAESCGRAPARARCDRARSRHRRLRRHGRRADDDPALARRHLGVAARRAAHEP